jgi:hypothetical protein
MCVNSFIAAANICRSGLKYIYPRAPKIMEQGPQAMRLEREAKKMEA